MGGCTAQPAQQHRDTQVAEPVRLVMTTTYDTKDT
jgi:hypothetical protein